MMGKDKDTNDIITTNTIITNNQRTAKGHLHYSVKMNDPWTWRAWIKTKQSNTQAPKLPAQRG